MAPAAFAELTDFEVQENSPHEDDEKDTSNAAAYAVVEACMSWVSSVCEIQRARFQN
jgi:hypothetical protein